MRALIHLVALFAFVVELVEPTTTFVRVYPSPIINCDQFGKQPKGCASNKVFLDDNTSEHSSSGMTVFALEDPYTRVEILKVMSAQTYHFLFQAQIDHPPILFVLV